MTAPSPASPLGDLAGELTHLYRLGRSKSARSRVETIFAELAKLGVRACGELDGFEGCALLESYRRSLDESGRAAATQKTKLVTLKHCLRYAVKRGYLLGNPFDVWDVRVIGKKLRVKRHLTLEEICLILDGLKREANEGWREHELYAVVSTVAYCGLRSTEALRLRHEDIDLASRTLSIVRRTGLKTESSERRIPIPDALVEVLATWLPESGSEWVFPHTLRDGPWLHGSATTKPLNCFQAAAARHGVRKVTFLSLRHSWATLATMCWGLSPAQVGKLMGHTRMSTAYENYIESDVEAMRGGVAVIRFPTLDRRGEHGPQVQPTGQTGT